MTNQEYSQKITDFMSSYCDVVQRSLNERWNKIPLELFDSGVYEVIGGLLARQATLSIQLAENPGIWNGHIAPLILRSMTDAHITLAWILVEDFEKRAKQYIDYGLGQEKKFIEHLKKESEDDDEDNEDLKELIEIKEKWLESQKYPFLTEVDLGSWSGINTRKMAIESDCETVYKFAYEPFSAVAHNMWQHISVYNLKICQNPLHKFHRVPTILSLPLDEDYVFKSSKYLSKSFAVFDKKFDLSFESLLPIDWYLENIEHVYENLNEGNQDAT